MGCSAEPALQYRLVRDQRRSSSWIEPALGSCEKIESWALRRKTFQLFPEKSSALVQCARVPLQQLLLRERATRLLAMGS